MEKNRTAIILEETLGIARQHEPVTVGIPFPRGLVSEVSQFRIADDEQGLLPLQGKTLARWPDDSLKWGLFDFQVSLEPLAAKRLMLEWVDDDSRPGADCVIGIVDENARVSVDTGAAVFRIGKNPFRLFERVIIKGKEIIDRQSSRIALRDVRGTEYEAVLQNLKWETTGPLRRCLKAEGAFESGMGYFGARFFARVTFYAGKPFVKIDFTLHNPLSAQHPGGLWDLGDKGSLFFKDLSIDLGLFGGGEATEAFCSLYEDPVPMDYQDYPRDIKKHLKSFHSQSEDAVSSLPPRLLIYQDSSGGENWQSRSHVNRNNEVRTSFRGYRVVSGSQMLSDGLRANPTISVKSQYAAMAAAIRHFWQNFPSALEVDGRCLSIHLFPRFFNDEFELQGGEQKTQTVCVSFHALEGLGNDSDLHWIHEPLIGRAEPKWYVESAAIPYLVGRDEVEDPLLDDLVSTAVVGDNTFFHRREIIDEYGWRHFGDLYADHENALNEGTEPLISHYNNQYDCLYGMLFQFMRSGDCRWFLLADQLGSHVKDIDIYHTGADRPEYNHGLFWHTEHYTDAQTATHRCYSARYADRKDLANYGGGPSLSHNYATGLVYHFFLTGNPSPAEAVEELAGFVRENFLVEKILLCRALNLLRKFKSMLKPKDPQQLVQFNKVYGLDGPGRASGNAVNTLVDVFVVTDDLCYLECAEEIIRICIHPEDDITRRDLLDIENRWMYTVFLQALGKYLDVKSQLGQADGMREYARACLLNYAEWMVKNERFYMDTPERLEYPNETWPAQELRKCNVFLFAHKYSSTDDDHYFLDKAEYFFNIAIKQLLGYETKTLTRPMALMLQNGFMFSAYRCKSIERKSDTNVKPLKNGYDRRRFFKRLRQSLRYYSPAREVKYMRNRIWLGK